VDCTGNIIHHWEAYGQQLCGLQAKRQHTQQQQQQQQQWQQAALAFIVSSSDDSASKAQSQCCTPLGNAQVTIPLCSYSEHFALFCSFCFCWRARQYWGA
jgi:Tfp pilus assembly protein PilV